MELRSLARGCAPPGDSAPVVHVYELDRPTGAYVPTGIVRGRLELSVPFRIGVDLDALVLLRAD